MAPFHRHAEPGRAQQLHEGTAYAAADPLMPWRSLPHAPREQWPRAYDQLPMGALNYPPAKDAEEQHYLWSIGPPSDSPGSSAGTPTTAGTAMDSCDSVSSNYSARSFGGVSSGARLGRHEVSALLQKLRQLDTKQPTSPIVNSGSIQVPPPPAEWRDSDEEDYSLEVPPPPAEWRAGAEVHSEAELEELLACVPLDEQGNPTSVGSISHATGKCKRCLFVSTKVGCVNGVLCPFCHFPHSRKKPMRPNKEKRNRFNRFLAAMSDLVEQDPSIADDPEKVLDVFTGSEVLKAKLMLRMRERADRVRAQRLAVGAPTSGAHSGAYDVPHHGLDLGHAEPAPLVRPPPENRRPSATIDHLVRKAGWKDTDGHNLLVSVENTFLNFVSTDEALGGTPKRRSKSMGAVHDSRVENRVAVQGSFLGLLGKA